MSLKVLHELRLKFHLHNGFPLFGPDRLGNSLGNRLLDTVLLSLRYDAQPSNDRLQLLNISLVYHSHRLTFRRLP